jgi:hypothetical protein
MKLDRHESVLFISEMAAIKSISYLVGICSILSYQSYLLALVPSALRELC